MNMQGLGSCPLYKLTGRQMMQCAEIHTHSILQLTKNTGVLPACESVCTLTYGMIWRWERGSMCVCLRERGKIMEYYLCAYMKAWATDGVWRELERKCARNVLCVWQCVHARCCASVKSRLLASIQQAAIYILLSCSEPECCRGFSVGSSAHLRGTGTPVLSRNSKGEHYSIGTEK